LLENSHNAKLKRRTSSNPTAAAIPRFALLSEPFLVVHGKISSTIRGKNSVVLTEEKL
jgi:hypothetical protein